MPHSLKFSYRLIPFTAITFDLFWSLHPWMGEEIPSSLQQSFTRTGILNPPCLIPTENKTEYTILTGHRRFLFAQTNSATKQQILCKCYQYQPSPQHCLNIIAADQQFSGEGLSLAEKAQLLHLASRQLSKNEVFKEFFPMLELKRNPELFKTLLHLARENKKLLQDIHTGQISLQIYTELQQLPENDRTALLNLFEILQLGGGKQRRFLQQIRDCAYRKSQTIPQFLEKTKIKNILEHNKLNITQKTQHLGRVLENFLQPRLQQAEQEFNNKIRQLSLPNNYEVEHSPAFEKNEVSLKIKFSNLNDCRQYIIKSMTQ